MVYTSSPLLPLLRVIASDFWLLWFMRKFTLQPLSALIFTFRVIGVPGRTTAGSTAMYSNSISVQLALPHAVSVTVKWLVKQEQVTVALIQSSEAVVLTSSPISLPEFTLPQCTEMVLSSPKVTLALTSQLLPMVIVVPLTLKCSDEAADCSQLPSANTATRCHEVVLRVFLKPISFGEESSNSPSQVLLLLRFQQQLYFLLSTGISLTIIWAAVGVFPSLQKEPFCVGVPSQVRLLLLSPFIKYQVISALLRASFKDISGTLVIYSGSSLNTFLNATPHVRSSCAPI